MRPCYLVLLLALAAAPLSAQTMSAFHPGPVFADFGPIADVPGAEKLPATTILSVAFDVSEGAKDGERSRAIETASRFINLHVANGVPLANLHVAIVVHGKAVLDVLSAEGRGAHKLADNPSAPMVRAMLDKGVRVIVCGQSAAGQGVTRDQLIPGVEMALSAMTAFAQLQRQGYTVNPF